MGFGGAILLTAWAVGCSESFAQEASSIQAARHPWSVVISANVGSELLRVFLVFLNAGLAAEFHFLVAIYFADGTPHGAELVVSDDTGVAGVAFDARSTSGGTGAEEKCCGDDCGCDVCFHLWLVVFCFSRSGSRCLRRSRVRNRIP